MCSSRWYVIMLYGASFQRPACTRSHAAHRAAVVLPAQHMGHTPWTQALQQCGPASQKCKRRADKGGVLHAGIGKVSFAVEKLRENLAVLASAVVAARPKRAKGANFGGYVQKAPPTPGSCTPRVLRSQIACSAWECVLASGVVAAWPSAVLQHGARKPRPRSMGAICAIHLGPRLSICMTPARTCLALEGAVCAECPAVIHVHV